MSFLDDAKAFMDKKESEKQVPQSEDFLMSEQSVEKFANELRGIYENATWPEIYKAIDWVKETCEKPYDKNMVLKKIRIKLED